MRTKSTDLGTLLLLAIASLAPTIAKADLVVDIPSITMSAGGTGSADVMIHSTTGTDQLSGYSVDFHITSSNNSNELDFTYIPANQAALLSNSNYVFGANGGTQDSSNVGSIGPPTTYSVGDLANGGPVTVTTSSELLAHLDFTTLTGAPPVPGDTYTITTDIVPGPDFFGPTTDGTVPATGNDGGVTVDGAAGVPEPSSLLLLAAGLGAGWYRTRRARVRS